MKSFDNLNKAIRYSRSNTSHQNWPCIFLSLNENVCKLVNDPNVLGRDPIQSKQICEKSHTNFYFAMPVIKLEYIERDVNLVSNPNDKGIVPKNQVR